MVVDIRNQEIKELANKVLADNNVTKPPIPVVQIVKNNGLDIVATELPSDVAGFVDPETKTIFVNQKDPDGRKAFTMMVALGHVLLHEKEMKHDPDVAVVYRRPVEITESKFDDEAFAFASEILIPKEMLKHSRKKIKGVAPEESEGLGVVFGVTPEVVQSRLKLFDQEDKDE